MITTRLSDLRFFTECVDSSIPALASLPALAEAGNFAEAQRIFAAYVRGALDADHYLAGEKEKLAADADSVRAAAERALAHTVVSCRVPYTFGEVIDWEYNPTYNGYREWPWQMNRHPEWRALARYYILTGDERAAADWAKQLISWAIQAQVPENASGHATVCWRTIEAGIRVNCWTYVIHAFLHSPSISDEVITIFFKSLWEHGWRLREFNTTHNWLIIEMNGLLRLGMVFPFFRESAEWMDYACRRLGEELDAQVYPDGMQFELSMGYHSMVANLYEGLLELFRKMERPAPDYLEWGIRRLYSCYPKLVRPDLVCPTMNDGKSLNVQPASRRAAQLYPDVPEFRYIGSARAEGAPPTYTSILLEYSGAAVLRSGWDPQALWAYMDCSPFGRAHQHEDKLNIQLFALGHELLCEGGQFDYDASEMRKYVLSTRAHNTIRVDGHDQARRDGYKWEPEMIHQKVDAFFESTPARDTVQADYTEGYGAEHIPVKHSRRLVFVKDEAGLPPMYIAVDRLTAEDEERHSYEVLWHMHDNPTTLAGRTVTNEYEDGVGITVSSSEGGVGLVRGQKAPVFQGWLPKYGIGDVEHYPIPTILNTGYFTKSQRIVTVLCPYDGGAPRVASVEASADIADTRIVIRLTDGREAEIGE